MNQTQEKEWLFNRYVKTEHDLTLMAQGAKVHAATEEEALEKAKKLFPDCHNCVFVEHIPGAPKMIHLSFGPKTKVIMIAGRPHYFEMHRALGPMAVNKRGDGIKGTETFWYAVTCWAQQGEKEENGICVWKPTKGGI